MPHLFPLNKPSPATLPNMYEMGKVLQLHGTSKEGDCLRPGEVMSSSYTKQHTTEV